MPKKGKAKSPGPVGKNSPKPEALPQVWLPDQVGRRKIKVHSIEEERGRGCVIEFCMQTRTHTHTQALTHAHAHTTHTHITARAA